MRFAHFQGDTDILITPGAKDANSLSYAFACNMRVSNITHI